MKDRHKTNYEKKTKPVFKDTSLLVGDLARSFPLEVSRLRSSFAGQHSCTRGGCDLPTRLFFCFRFISTSSEAMRGCSAGEED